MWFHHAGRRLTDQTRISDPLALFFYAIMMHLLFSASSDGSLLAPDSA
jgi:hypothetical protein